MATPTIYEIDQNMLALEAILEEIGGEVTDEEIEAQITAWFNENEKDLLDKLDGYGAVIRNHEAMQAARKAEAARISGLAKTNENVVERLKNRLKLFLKAHNIQKVESTRFKWSVANNGGKAPMRLSMQAEADPLTLPSKYVTEKTVYEIDRDALYLAATKGTEEEKAELEGLVEIGERGDHLRIA